MGNVIGETCDQRARGEPVEAGRGEVLNLLKDCAAQISAESLRWLGGKPTCTDSTRNPHQRDTQH